MDVVWVRETIYLPTPYVDIFLGGELMPMEACTHLWGLIVNVGVEDDCHPLIDWLRVALTRKEGQYQTSPLVIPWLTTLLMYEYLLHYWYPILVNNLPGLDPSLTQAQGFLIAIHIGQVAVELRKD